MYGTGISIWTQDDIIIAANEITTSRDVTGWGNLTTPIVTFDQIGLDGSSNSASWAEDDNITAGEGKHYTIPQYTGIGTLRVFIKKDLDESRMPAVYFRVTGGTIPADTTLVKLNTKTGAHVPNGTGLVAVNSYDDWWEILIQQTNDGTNTVRQIRLYPAYSDTLSNVFQLASAVGAIIVGNVEFYSGLAISGVAGKLPKVTL